jgi:diacylglycerol kinase family enzyme
MVIGGDGTFSSIGTALLGTDITIGIIPVGSGNGLARHFGIPLSPEAAVKALANGVTTQIDVGIINNRPFFVTCSMAWDAALVQAFDKSPVRGILPYIFAGAYQLLEYKPQKLRIELDSGERLSIPDPLVCTVANLTQYGGGAIIAPHAKPDDGMLELVMARRQDIPYFFANIGRLLSGKVTSIPKVTFRRFRSLTVIRDQPAPIQVDGELVKAPARFEIKVRHKILKILVPRQAG